MSQSWLGPVIQDSFSSKFPYYSIQFTVNYTNNRSYHYSQHLCTHVWWNNPPQLIFQERICIRKFHIIETFTANIVRMPHIFVRLKHARVYFWAFDVWMTECKRSSCISRRLVVAPTGFGLMECDINTLSLSLCIFRPNIATGVGKKVACKYYSGVRQNIFSSVSTPPPPFFF